MCESISPRMFALLLIIKWLLFQPRWNFYLFSIAESFDSILKAT